MKNCRILFCVFYISCSRFLGRNFLALDIFIRCSVSQANILFILIHRVTPNNVNRTYLYIRDPNNAIKKYFSCSRVLCLAISLVVFTCSSSDSDHGNSNTKKKERKNINEKNLKMNKIPFHVAFIPSRLFFVYIEYTFSRSR